MDIFNTNKQFSFGQLPLNDSKLNSMLWSRDIHIIVRTLDDTPLYNTFAERYLVKIYVDLELVFQCEANEEPRSIENYHIHPLLHSSLDEIIGFTMGYLNAPEFLFEMSELCSVELQILTNLHSADYQILSVNEDLLLVTNSGHHIATLSIAEPTQEVHFEFEFIGSQLFSHKLLNSVLDVYRKHIPLISLDVQNDLIEKLVKMNTDLQQSKSEAIELLKNLTVSTHLPLR